LLSGGEEKDATLIDRPRGGKEKDREMEEQKLGKKRNSATSGKQSPATERRTTTCRVGLRELVCLAQKERGRIAAPRRKKRGKVVGGGNGC